MNIIILGAAGFIGTNLTISLAKDKNNRITIVDKNKEYFANIQKYNFENVEIIENQFNLDNKFEELLYDKDVVYHLLSTTVPGTSNQHISQELNANVIFSANLLDLCVKCNVKKFAFISSGGAVYGKESKCPLSENTPTNPITSYGIQKVTIEKLLYLYNYLYGLDYNVIRLANPYGPYQRPNGILGVVTTFTYNALNNKEITVYGDGNVIRDFIYIDDAINAIIKIINSNTKNKIYNLGCGYGTSINDVINTLENVLNKKVNVAYKAGRAVDVPINYLDISRYENEFGSLNPVSLENGIKMTIEFMKRNYK